MRQILTIVVLLTTCAFTSSDARQEVPNDPHSGIASFDYEIAQKHEMDPHRRTISVAGVDSGFNQLRLSVIVSPTGSVMDVSPSGDEEDMRRWPAIEDEVRQWRFAPFEKDGRPVTAEVEEYVNLVPPERFPKVHVVPPVLTPESRIVITLERTGCFGTCPAYRVSITTDGIFFEGRAFVVAAGRHEDKIDSDEVQNLARKFIAADFYSMESRYVASVTDNPTYVLTISIDGHVKQVTDYVGSWVGMPSIITQLEDDVDRIARTSKWVAGTEGLVAALQNEGFNFQTVEAQMLLKKASRNGMATTVGDLLGAGVPLSKLQPHQEMQDGSDSALPHIGFLQSASIDLDTLRVLIAAGASKNDQFDKDVALATAAGNGNVEAARVLIAYGADPNSALSERTITEHAGAFAISSEGAGSILIYAAGSGNPDMVREILKYHPDLDKRDSQGRTAVFAAGQYRYRDVDGARVECLRLLAQAGADVNAKDKDGNTPLHEIYLTDVEEELLKLGANVNARNKDGETPIFTNVDNEAISLFLKYGADLSIRNNRGQSVFDDASEKGPARKAALQEAVNRMPR